MSDRTFPIYGGLWVYLGHRLRGHHVWWKRSLMLSQHADPQPCRIYDCDCGRAWVAYE